MRHHTVPDRGAIDVSVQMLFGVMAVLSTLLLIGETVIHWHTRNVFAEAAAEGARVAAAFDGSCEQGVDAARAMVERSAGGWSDDVQVTCASGATVQVAIAGRTAGLVGFTASVSESVPRER